MSLHCLLSWILDLQSQFLAVSLQFITMHLMCSKKLTSSQLSPPHGTNSKIKEKWTKNKSRSVILISFLSMTAVSTVVVNVVSVNCFYCVCSLTLMTQTTLQRWHHIWNLRVTTLSAFMIHCQCGDCRSKGLLYFLLILTVFGLPFSVHIIWLSP